MIAQVKIIVVMLMKKKIMRSVENVLLTNPQFIEDEIVFDVSENEHDNGWQLESAIHYRARFQTFQRREQKLVC